MNILEQILETKYHELQKVRAAVPFETIYEQAKAVTRPVLSLSAALRASGTGIIAEFKRKSPSLGFINRDADVREVAAGYAAAGAAAISVLTDTDYFGGSLDDLRQAREVTNVPLLRKDFITDPYQICEARLAGADAVLLIASALSVEQSVVLAAFARSLGLEVLLELHNEQEMRYINDGVDIVGVNNRDLSTFVTEIRVSERLAPLIPAGLPKVSESGISDPETIRTLRAVGYSGFLMGENFMKQPVPAEALADFIGQL